MADESAMRALQHAIHHADPIKAGEIKEAFLRHILSSPDDKEGKGIARLLVDIYKRVWDRDSMRGMPRVKEADQAAFFRSWYERGFRESAPDSWTEDCGDWPHALPDDIENFPEGLLAEVSWLLGKRDADRILGRIPGPRS